MLAITRKVGTPYAPATTEAAVVVPPIVATAAPAYVPPMDPFIPPNPVLAPTPPGTFRGEGGTPFGFRPVLYIQPMVPVVLDGGYDLSGYSEVPAPAKGAIPANPVRPGRPGKDQVMPVPTGQQPTKPAIAPAVQSVEQPGPITGTVAGFDLSRIPFWAWLAGAAFLGSRLLR